MGTFIAGLLLLACSHLSFITNASRVVLPDPIVDDFENGLTRWIIYGENAAHVQPSGDSRHGHVLVLSPNGDAHVLLKGTERWTGTRFEADVQFPTSGDSYLGLLTNFRSRGERMDFGLVYLKGNDSYLQANPHYDYNVTRTFYPEYQVPISDPHSIKAGTWHHIVSEVIAGTVHIYIDDARTPTMTFAFNPAWHGAVGFQPRSVGSDVWLDNVQATEIRDFRYKGNALPDVAYVPDSLVRNWNVIGPFARTDDTFAQRPQRGEWRKAIVDARGAVLTAPTVDFHGDRTVAYYRTTVIASDARTVTLHLSSVEDLAVWVNGRFHWFVPRTSAAWYDFFSNPQHAGRRIPVELSAGENFIVMRVRGGAYAGGGFFARLEPAN